MPTFEAFGTITIKCPPGHIFCLATQEDPKRAPEKGSNQGPNHACMVEPMCQHAVCQIGFESNGKNPLLPSANQNGATSKKGPRKGVPGSLPCFDFASQRSVWVDTNPLVSVAPTFFVAGCVFFGDPGCPFRVIFGEATGPRQFLLGPSFFLSEAQTSEPFSGPGNVVLRAAGVHRSTHRRQTARHLALGFP